ncbi:TSC22 domain family 1-like isoform X2 [Chlorella sorokiniana]|uniref:TSC22 domain family 1-like isoform X2 n=1 Tax=Chlorella sorokiniana TaxID=3076 RepID=A0A2P6TZC1_CHLSO|nr:TSC22 domain family 1-like isoform X2 [Chlorella sorokiniana]|eukprot:PRW59418.1 TSC22 domain family 1-like isoform X2 [Chlorella sorokiniana]
MASGSCVTPYELAVLVHAYLHSHGFRKTAASFKREGKPLFCAAGGTAPPPGVRSLLELLNDYVRLKEVEARRLALAGRNPLARRMLEALDLEAGQQQQVVTAEAAAAAAQQQQAAAAAAVVQQVQQPLHAFVPVQPSGGYAFGQPPAHLHPLDLAAAAPAAAGQQQQQHGGTPGRHRKGQPRKRQRLGDGGAADAAAAAAAAAAADGLGHPGMGSGGLFGDGGGSGAGWGSPLDILNQPLDAGGLEALLDDGPLQKAFAEHLAQHINTTVFGVHAPAPAAQGEAAQEAAAAAAGSAQPAAAAAEEDGGEGYLEHFMADPQMVLAELPTDPEVLQVLQQVVRPSTASPPHTRPTSRQQKAAAAAAQQQQQQSGEAQRQGAEAMARQLKAAMAEMDLPASRDQLLQELDELDDMDFA